MLEFQEIMNITPPHKKPAERQTGGKCHIFYKKQITIINAENKIKGNSTQHLNDKQQENTINKQQKKANIFTQENNKILHKGLGSFTMMFIPG